ncbi:hypothetical protein FJY63_12790, partial [Candidatus Sumerlaeota bacterium]|nr:hypothetical protein [Candidatus Sumerlaeota bacterium]
MFADRIIERVRSGLVLLALAATALITIPLTYDQYVLPKTVWAKVLIELIAATALFRLAVGGDLRLRIHWLNLLLLLFVVWKALSWFWAESR